MEEFENRFKDFENVIKYSDVYYNAMGCNISNQPKEVQLELCAMQAYLELISIQGEKRH